MRKLIFYAKRLIDHYNRRPGYFIITLTNKQHKLIGLVVNSQTVIYETYRSDPKKEHNVIDHIISNWSPQITDEVKVPVLISIKAFVCLNKMINAEIVTKYKQHHRMDILMQLLEFQNSLTRNLAWLYENENPTKDPTPVATLIEIQNRERSLRLN